MGRNDLHIVALISESALNPKLNVHHLYLHLNTDLNLSPFLYFSVILALYLKYLILLRTYCSFLARPSEKQH